MARILLIDDDTILLKLYSTKLTADKHQVATATNGEEGLIQVKKFQPNIIILDLLMPKLNGFAFLEMLNQDPVTKAIPLIVFSSVANQEQINRLTQLGIDTYLNKTDTTPTQLVNIINQKLSSQTQAPQPQTPSPNTQ